MPLGEVDVLQSGLNIPLRKIDHPKIVPKHLNGKTQSAQVVKVMGWSNERKERRCVQLLGPFPRIRTVSRMRTSSEVVGQVGQYIHKCIYL